MRKCPRCGYVDPAAIEAGRKYDATRDKRDRAAYMREYRARKAKERKAAKRNGGKS